MEAAPTGWHRELTPLLHSAFWFGLTGPPLALLLGRAELVVTTAPFALVAVVALVSTYEPDVAVRLGSPTPKVLEGQELSVQLAVTGSPRVTVRVELEVWTPQGRSHQVAAARIGPNGGAELELPLDTGRWGLRSLTITSITVDSALGLVRHRRIVHSTAEARVFPAPERLRELIAPQQTRARLGDLASRTTGSGVEFAGTRPYRVGDDRRAINWRATARRQEIWVSRYHTERSADVVLFIDTSRDVAVGDEPSSVHAVRVAHRLAQGYLRDQARVGIVTYGTIVRWLSAGVGRRQLYRISETLIDAQRRARTGSRGLAAIPPRVLPSGALVIVITALTHRRTAAAIAELRAMGHDVAVIDLPPDGSAGAGDLDARLFLVARRAARARLESLGVPVVTAAPGRSLDGVLNELRTWRRQAAGRR